jgi:hypothetical protein
MTKTIQEPGTHNFEQQTLASHVVAISTVSMIENKRMIDALVSLFSERSYVACYVFTEAYRKLKAKDARARRAKK